MPGLEVANVSPKKPLGGRGPGGERTLDVVGLSRLTGLCIVAWTLGAVPLGWWSPFLRRGTGECVPTIGRLDVCAGS